MTDSKQAGRHRLHRFVLGKLDVELYVEPRFRDWNFHVWIGDRGMHAFIARGALKHRIYFERAAAAAAQASS